MLKNAMTNLEGEYSEGDIEGLKIGVKTLNALAERFEVLEGYEQDAVQALLEDVYNFEEALDIVERGAYTLYDCESLADLAKQLVEEGCFGDPGNLVNYIDYERLGRDLGLDGYMKTSKGVILVD